MPTNLYGMNDNYHPENSHVLPALIHRILMAKIQNEPTVTIWGSGMPRREFLHVDDLAEACIFLLQEYTSDDIINIGSGTDITIKELGSLIAKIVDYQGNFLFDSNRLDGTPRKLLDVSKINELGWQSKINLNDGLTSVIKEYSKNTLKYSL
jgi:GDP-L-fucose synthase